MEEREQKSLKTVGIMPHHVNVTAEQTTRRREDKLKQSERILIEYILSLYPTYTKFPFRL